MVFNNALVGQNGFLTAALIGGTLYLIPVRPILAGVCLGLLSYKPQYGLLFPIVLIAASQWTVFFTAGCRRGRHGVRISWLAFGTESWQAFFHWMPMFSQAFLTEGKAPWWKMQSLFSLVRYFGGTESVAWAFQWVLTASVAVVLALMWRSRISYSLKAAALAVGTLADHALSLHVRPDGAGDAGGFPGPHRAERPASAAYELPALGCALALCLCRSHLPAYRSDSASP